ncbi:MAG: GAF domain-containing protein [Campylobacterota bacterium]|nr:GAF domain-containing protein [Campylobacterota bacterium]
MNDKYKKLSTFGRELLEKTSLVEGLPFISFNAKEIIGADRCSVFIYDKEENELWTTIADGVEKIVIPSDMGIVGHIIRLKKPILENDAYGNPNFLSDVDIKTGYYTQNLLTSPIFDSQNEIIGAFQLLNKEGGFDKKDLDFITFFAHYVSSFIELELNYL